MNRQLFVSSLWNCHRLLPAALLAMVLVLPNPSAGQSQSSAPPPDSAAKQGQTPPLSVPEQFTLPDLPLLRLDIGDVSRRIRAATDYLFGQAQSSNIDALRKGPLPQASQPARALRALKTWLEEAGCVNKANVPLLSGMEPSAFALQTSFPGQIPLSVSFYLAGQKTTTIDYTIWLAPGPGLRHVDVTWETTPR